MRSLTLAEVGASVGTVSLDRTAGSATVARVATDSRHVRAGDLFWAIAGERFDGHEFVGQSFANGAVAAVVRRGFAGIAGQASRLPPQPLLEVDDTRLALGRFAAWYRRSCRARVIGVTGSVGKTSTREAIYAVLSQRWAGLRSGRNFNNDIGVPLSLLELDPRHQFAVIEMGASGAGEIARLAQIAGPQIGVLTAIGETHLEGFGSIDGVARAKAELVAALGPTGTAVLNADDVRLRAIGRNAACRLIWYGTQERVQGSGFRVQVDQSRGPEPIVWGHEIEAAGETVSFRWDGGPRVTLAAPGRHQVYAALAAVAVGRTIGMSDREMAVGLEKYRPAEMRGQVERLDGVTVINDAYNASPPSMWAALDMLERWPTSGRRVFVCGDMKELGPLGPEYHRRLGEEIARRRTIDYCVAVGSLSINVAEAARWSGMPNNSVLYCESVEQATEVLRRTLQSGDVVLVKASRAMQLEQVIVGIRPRSVA